MGVKTHAMKIRKGLVICQVFGCKDTHEYDPREVLLRGNVVKSSYKEPQNNYGKQRYCTGCFASHHKDCQTRKLMRRRKLNCMCECPQCRFKRRTIMWSSFYGMVYYHNL